MGEDEVQEVHEIKDDSDSDDGIMEVDQDDPLAAKASKGSMMDPETGEYKGKIKGPDGKLVNPSTIKATEVKKPQVVTIDDPKALQALASSAAKSKAALSKDRVTIIDTAQILAGRSNSGVTITPAAGNRLTGSHAYAGMSDGKLPLPGNLAASLASSGVTISSKTTQLPGGHHQNVQAAAVKPETHSIPGSNFVYDSKGQLQDPNLTDDTIVIEAPSFIVPYVYEKPPREAFQDFKAEIKKMMAEIKAKLAEEEKLKIEKGEKIEDAEDKEEDPEDKPISKMEDTRF